MSQGAFPGASRKSDGYCVECRTEKKAKWAILLPEFQVGRHSHNGKYPCCHECWDSVGLLDTDEPRDTTPKKAKTTHPVATPSKGKETGMVPRCDACHVNTADSKYTLTINMPGYSTAPRIVEGPLVGGIP